MATDYSKLTLKELIEVVDALEKEHGRQKVTVQQQKMCIESLQKRTSVLTAELAASHQVAERARRRAAMHSRACTSLGGAWLDMIEYLRGSE